MILEIQPSLKGNYLHTQEQIRRIVSQNGFNQLLLHNSSALKLCCTIMHPPFLPLQPLIPHTSFRPVHLDSFNLLSNIPLLRSIFHYHLLTVLSLDTACLPFQGRLFPYSTACYHGNSMTRCHWCYGMKVPKSDTPQLFWKEQRGMHLQSKPGRAGNAVNDLLITLLVWQLPVIV